MGGGGREGLFVQRIVFISLGAVSRKPAPAPTSLWGWPSPGSAARRFRTCTSCGSPVVPLLAHPDKTVKLSIKAWTGWEALTGNNSHWVLGSGPAERITNTNPSETAMNCATVKLIMLDDQATANPPEEPFQVSCFQNSMAKMLSYSKTPISKFLLDDFDVYLII